MSDNVPFGGSSPILLAPGAVTGSELALATMIEALRSQTSAIERYGIKVDGLSNVVAKVREDIAVMQIRDEQIVALHSSVEAIKNEMQALKLRNAQQDGGFKAANVLKEWSPWLVSLAFGAYIYLQAIQ